jgi:hypothetical protein
MGVSFRFRHKEFNQLVKRVGIGYERMARDILRRYDVVITSMTLRLYCGAEKRKVNTPHIDKLAILSRYFTEKLNEPVKIDDFFELDDTPHKRYE